MKNTLTDLNNYLFEALERVNDDSLNEDQLEQELRKADTIVQISEKVIEIGDLAFRTMQHMDKYGYGSCEKQIPKMLEYKGD